MRPRSPNLSRATARRVLRTLAQLGYVVQDGRAFSLTPRVLELGFAYLSGQDWIDRALPMMKEAERATRRILLRLDPAGHRDRLCRARHGAAHHVDRAGGWQPACRPFTPRSAAPSSAISTMRKSGAACGRHASKRYTPYTITDMQALFDRVRADREQGFSIVDEELERGLRSIAVPVLDRTGQAVGAINLSAHSHPHDAQRDARAIPSGAQGHRAADFAGAAVDRNRNTATALRIERLVRAPERFYHSSSISAHKFAYRTNDMQDPSDRISGRAQWQEQDEEQDGRAARQPRRPGRKPAAAATASAFARRPENIGQMEVTPSRRPARSISNRCATAARSSSMANASRTSRPIPPSAIPPGWWRACSTACMTTSGRKSCCCRPIPAMAE